jgi:hypothetical protein
LTQSLAVKAYYAANPPKIELPEYWDALENMDDMTPEQRRSAAEAGISTAPKFSQLLEGTHGFNTVVVVLFLFYFCCLSNVGQLTKILLLTLAEANFHYVVQRSALRPESPAWKRVESGSQSIPPEMEDWVKSASASA